MVLDLGAVDALLKSDEWKEFLGEGLTSAQNSSQIDVATEGMAAEPTRVRSPNKEQLLTQMGAANVPQYDYSSPPSAHSARQSQRNSSRRKVGSAWAEYGSASGTHRTSFQQVASGSKSSRITNSVPSPQKQFQGTRSSQRGDSFSTPRGNNNVRLGTALDGIASDDGIVTVSVEDQLQLQQPQRRRQRNLSLPHKRTEANHRPRHRGLRNGRVVSVEDQSTPIRRQIREARRISGAYNSIVSNNPLIGVDSDSSLDETASEDDHEVHGMVSVEGQFDRETSLEWFATGSQTEVGNRGHALSGRVLSDSDLVLDSLEKGGYLEEKGAPVAEISGGIPPVSVLRGRGPAGEEEASQKFCCFNILSFKCLRRCFRRKHDGSD